MADYGCPVIDKRRPFDVKKSVFTYLCELTSPSDKEGGEGEGIRLPVPILRLWFGFPGPVIIK
jgi:hypothetical protein